MSKSPSLRRIQADVRELSLDPSDQYYAAPLESDMHEWHFTIRGAPDTDFAGGIYHGRILLPPEYPFKPPHIVFLTPSGRFETHTKVCLSFSAFHPELWQPAWGIRLILEALIAFLPSPADGAIGSLDWSSEERKRLAAKSKDFCCPLCGKVADLLPVKDDNSSESEKKPSRFQKEIEKLQLMQSREHKKEEKEEQAEIQTKKDAESAAASSAVDSSASDRQSPPLEEAQRESKMPPSSPSPSPATPLSPSPRSHAVDVSDVSLDASNNPLTSQSNENMDGTAPPTPKRGAATAAATASMQVPVDDTTPVIMEHGNNLQREVTVDDGGDNDDPKPSWLVEPALQMAILVLSVICVLLVRKIQALCEELQALEEL